MCFLFHIKMHDVFNEKVCRDPRWGRCYESFSEDPTTVRKMTEIVAGLQGEVPDSQKGNPYIGGK